MDNKLNTLFNKIPVYLISRTLKKRLRGYYLVYNPNNYITLYKKYRFQRYCKGVIEFKKRWNRGIYFFLPYRIKKKRNIRDNISYLKNIKRNKIKIRKKRNGFSIYKIKNKKYKKNYDLFTIGTI